MFKKKADAHVNPDLVVVDRGNMKVVSSEPVTLGSGEHHMLHCNIPIWIDKAQHELHFEIWVGGGDVRASISWDNEKLVELVDDPEAIERAKQGLVELLIEKEPPRLEEAQ